MHATPSADCFSYVKREIGSAICCGTYLDEDLFVSGLPGTPDIYTEGVRLHLSLEVLQDRAVAATLTQFD